PGDAADTILSDPAYPFTLLTGTSLYHCGTLSTYAEGPLAVRPRAWIEINPLDAERLGIEGRDNVVVRSHHGGITVEARLNAAVPERILFASDHFRDAVINKLTQNTSLCQVTIEKKQ
ncbi:MAG: hypothetical protein NTV89_07520, partial [Proteobacteria bacterium]|nr:hypothetical protein [Pseudomonadota bacterium]